MTLEQFRQSLQREEPPVDLSFALAGLWWDAKGNWNRAHGSAQQDEGPAAPGCTPTCTTRREILPMRLIGTVALASRHPKVRLNKSGLTSPSHC